MESEYVKKYINLCSQLLYDKDEYENKIKVKLHNRAARKLTQLSKEITTNKEIAKEVFKELINNDNEVVRLWISDQCIKSNIYVTDAIKMLEKLCKSNNKLIAFEAKMTLKEYKVL